MLVGSKGRGAKPRGHPQPPHSQLPCGSWHGDRELG